jgi:hypothetical protein
VDALVMFPDSDKGNPPYYFQTPYWMRNTTMVKVCAHKDIECRDPDCATKCKLETKPMTHTPEVERLLKAAKCALGHLTGNMDGDMEIGEPRELLRQAIAAFEQKEEFEYVLPKEPPSWWFEFLRELQPSWKELRELTKRPKPEGKEYWMIEFDDGVRTWHPGKPMYSKARIQEIHVREVEETK